MSDVRYLSAGVPELENYLLSKELYYPIGLQFPPLTLGGILLALARLGFRAENFRIQAEAIQSRWRVAWDAKSSREVKARNELWMNYLADYREDSKSGARLYSQNVRYRAMLTLLGQSNSESDIFVKSVFKAGDFVWEKEIAQNFQRDSFWFLFGNLKS